MNPMWEESASEVQKQALKMPQDFLTDEPETTEQELDLKELFIRILEKDDWTDKLASVLGRVRDVFHRSRRDTRLGEDLRLLIPDMREVKKAYLEMTGGYKEFIRSVLEAQRGRKQRE